MKDIYNAEDIDKAQLAVKAFDDIGGDLGPQRGGEYAVTLQPDCHHRPARTDGVGEVNVIRYFYARKSR